MAQIGAFLVLPPEKNRGRTIYFRSIEKTEFHRLGKVSSLVCIDPGFRNCELATESSATISSPGV